METTYTSRLVNLLRIDRTILRLIAWIFRWPLVYTYDFINPPRYYDEDKRLRRIIKTSRGYYINGISSRTKGKLEANGEIVSGVYLDRWEPVNKYAREIYFLLNMEN